MSTTLKVDYEALSKDCDGSIACRCPLIGYANKDGVCYHPACLGPLPECGKPILIIEQS